MKKIKIKSAYIITVFLILILGILIILNSSKLNSLYNKDKFECGDKCNPQDLYDMNKMLDTSTLQTEILSDTQNDNVRIIKTRYYGTNWINEEIYLLADIYIPKNMPEENFGKAAISQKSSSAIEQGINFQKDFGENTAVLLKIPVILFGPENQVDETELARKLRIKMMENNDLTLEIVYPLTQSYMRTMTMAGTLEEAGNPEEFVTTGFSKRGYTQFQLSAVDNRVKGFMPNAYTAGNLINYWNLVNEDLGGETNLGNADESLAWLNTEAGQKYQDLYDPYQFAELIDKPFILTTGTNDRLYPINSANGFFPEFSSQKAFSIVENYYHGMGSRKHLENWRAIIQRSFFGRKTPSVIVNDDINGNNLNVNAQISNSEFIKSVKLYYSNHNDMDFSDSQWLSIEMQDDDNKYTASLEKTGNILAYYVEVEDEKDSVKAYSSSLVQIIN
ncbi:MAG: PhoPQ-activated protein PqaA family protein [archaeon]